MARDINTAQILAKNIDSYVNYDSILQKAEKEGSCMKEDKSFYEYCVLEGIKDIFEGLSLEQISAILLDCVAYADVTIPQE